MKVVYLSLLLNCFYDSQLHLRNVTTKIHIEQVQGRNSKIFFEE